MTTRRVTRTIPQGVDEVIAYPLDFATLAAVHGTVESATCKLFNQTKNRYENEKLSGDEGIAGTVVTSQGVGSLEARTMYLLSVAAVFSNGNTLSAVVPIMGEV
jgi:hypothetical protein